MEEFMIIEGKKFVWDGENYDCELSAEENIKKYGDDGFETKLLIEEGKYFVYTRRVVSEIKIECGTVN